MVHSSLSSMGYVPGGPETVISGLLEALGPDGTLWAVGDAEAPHRQLARYGWAPRVNVSARTGRAVERLVPALDGDAQRLVERVHGTVTLGGLDHALAVHGDHIHIDERDGIG